jgi:hypothetical protein
MSGIVSLFALLVVIGLFYKKESLGKYFWVAYLVVFPMLVYGITVGATAMAQSTVCGTTNMKMALTGSAHMIYWIYIAIGAAQISYLRAPVTSVVFAFMPTQYDENNKPMVAPGVTDTLEIEKGLPVMRGIATAYWIIFLGVFVGMVSSLGASTVCPSE